MPHALVIAFDPDFAPVTMDRNGMAAGLAIDLLKARLENAGIAHKFRPVALSDMEEELATGRVDAIAAMAMTPERMAIYDFGSPLLQTGGAWFATAPFSPGEGVRVATPRNGPLAAWLHTHFPGLAIVPVADYAAAFDAALSGAAAAAALNFHAGRHMCQTKYAGRFLMPDEPFMEIGLAPACLRGTCSELLAAHAR